MALKKRSSNDDDNGIVLSFHDTLLRQHDVQLLEGPCWLNDGLIGFCFEYYEREQFNHSADVLCFISPEVTQFIKAASDDDLGACLKSLHLNDKLYVFLAINDHERMDMPGGCHWSLLLYNRAVNEFQHYDSLTGSNSGVAANVATRLTPHLHASGKAVNVVEKRCPQQTNGYDCGVYVISVAEHLCKCLVESLTVDLSDAITPNAIAGKRRNILDLIDKLATSSTLHGY